MLFVFLVRVLMAMDVQPAKARACMDVLFALQLLQEPHI